MILVIGRREDRPQYDTAQSIVAGLSRAAPEANFKAIDFEDLVISFNGQQLRMEADGQDLAKAEKIYMLGWFKTKIAEELALAVAIYAEHHQIPLLNSEARVNRSKSKLSQYVLAALNGISMTPFVFTHDVVRLSQILAQGNKDLPLPFVAKNPLASRGNDNYLLKDGSEWADIPTDKVLIAQGFVPNDGDVRVLVFRGQIPFAIHRQSTTESHINNTSKGGAAEMIEVADLPAELQEQCLKIAKLLNREITGIDMIQHRETGQYYFLEANNMPQLSTGVLVDKKLQALAQSLLR